MSDISYSIGNRTTLLWKFILLATLIGLMAGCGTGKNVELTQKMTSIGGRLTVGYPADWTAKSEGDTIMLASNSTLLNSEDAPPAGLMRIEVTASQPETLFPGIGTNPGPYRVLEMMAVNAPITTSFSPPSVFQAGGYKASRTTATAGQITTEHIILEVADGQIVIVSATTLRGELAKVEATITAIVNSIRYNG